MKKQTICTAAMEALRKNGKSMSVKDIYDFIVKNNLYEFKAKEPLSILKSTLRKHTLGIETKQKKGISYFTIDSAEKYQTLK